MQKKLISYVCIFAIAFLLGLFVNEIPHKNIYSPKYDINLQKYDGLTITGSMLLNILDESNYSNRELNITVDNGEIPYIYTNPVKDSEKKSYKDKSSNMYISPSGKYTVVATTDNMKATRIK